MKGTKRSRPLSSRPVSSYFSAVSQSGNSTQPPTQESENIVAANDTAEPGTSNTQQQQQDDPVIVVNPDNQGNDTGTQHDNSGVELNPSDIMEDPGLRKPIEELDVNIRDA